MIRRNVPLGEQPEKWLLISQVEHARASAVLAEAWGGGQVPQLICGRDAEDPHLQDVREELLTAILHHDDGWAAWEADPAIDPEHGWPYSFTELPREQAIRLWTDSIRRAAEHGPLAGWAVAGHFVRLLSESEEPHTAQCEAWLEKMAGWRGTWLNEWHSLNRPVHRPRLASECLDWLRAFDWLSLWLAMRSATTDSDQQDAGTTLDDGLLTTSPVTFSPAGAWEGGGLVQASPWPFAADQLDIDMLGYAVAAREYTSRGELAKSRSPMRLRWRMVPG